MSNGQKQSLLSLTGNNVWIYGIGVVGKRVCKLFQYFNIQIKGILVTSMKGNISQYLRTTVTEFQNAEIVPDDIIVVTAVGKAQEEICKEISSKKLNFVVWSADLLCDLWKTSDFNFEDRKKNHNKLCMVLSGYKDFLWDDVFDRLSAFSPDDIDVCICSAGKYDSELSKYSEENGWSYLSTAVNSVSLTQNIAISLFPEAEWIYKMDEDMFITEKTFETMMTSSECFIKKQPYHFGLCSPLIPINGIGYRYILNKYELLDSYQEQFGTAYVGGNPKSEIECNPDTAEFMWERLPQIDELAKDAVTDSTVEICGSRLSIGLILFQRTLWEYMQGFLVYGSMDLGIDEEDMNAFCVNNSKAMIIAHNAIAGHFAFGKQTAQMKKYYLENKGMFGRKNHG